MYSSLVRLCASFWCVSRATRAITAANTTAEFFSAAATPKGGVGCAAAPLPPQKRITTTAGNRLREYALCELICAGVYALGCMVYGVGFACAGALRSRARRAWACK